MRKILVVTMASAMVLLMASLASAQAFSVFGGIGYGVLTAVSPMGEDGSLEYTTPAMALQVGGVYHFTENLGVGVLYDRLSHHESHAASVPGDDFSYKLSSVLSGFNAIATYSFNLSGMDLDVFGGLGSYGLVTTQSEDPGDDEKMEPNTRGLGFVGGARVKAPVASDLYLTGTFAYRSVSWGEVELESTDPSVPIAEYEWMRISGWSIGLGLAYEF